MTSEECDRVLELEAKLVMGEITLLDFLNAVPDEFIPRKEDLVKIIKEKNNGNNNSDL